MLSLITVISMSCPADAETKLEKAALSIQNRMKAAGRLYKESFLKRSESRLLISVHNHVLSSLPRYLRMALMTADRLCAI